MSPITAPGQRVTDMGHHVSGDQRQFHVHNSSTTPHLRMCITRTSDVKGCVYSMIDEATRFHAAQVLQNQFPMTMYEAIMSACLRWARPPTFVLVETTPVADCENLRGSSGHTRDDHACRSGGCTLDDSRAR